MKKKLLQKDLKLYREIQWEKQSGICPICNTYIEKEDAVLDHSHVTGHCRTVLHRNCNQLEGKIVTSFKRFLGYKDEIDIFTILKNLITYLKKDYSNNPIHPTELTELEKELKSINKRLKSLKRESVVLEYKKRAKELRKLIKEERELNSWRNDEV